MSSLQREFACIVLIDGIREQVESGCGMTMVAIFDGILLYELAIMIIGMAISTLGIFKRICKIGLMTLLTCNGTMLILELKLCF